LLRLFQTFGEQLVVGPVRNLFRHFDPLLRKRGWDCTTTMRRRDGSAGPEVSPSGSLVKLVSRLRAGYPLAKSETELPCDKINPLSLLLQKSVTPLYTTWRRNLAHNSVLPDSTGRNRRAGSARCELSHLHYHDPSRLLPSWIKQDGEYFLQRLRTLSEGSLLISRLSCTEPVWRTFFSTTPFIFNLYSRPWGMAVCWISVEFLRAHSRNFKKFRNTFNKNKNRKHFRYFCLTMSDKLGKKLFGKRQQLIEGNGNGRKKKWRSIQGRL